jgi:hypothetical protein
MASKEKQALDDRGLIRWQMLISHPSPTSTSAVA